MFKNNYLRLITLLLGITLLAHGGLAGAQKLSRAAPFPEVAAALRFARGEAMRTGAYHGVDFSADPGGGLRRIRVFRVDASAPSTPVYDVYHPVDHRPYELQTATRSGTEGTALDTVAFRFLKAGASQFAVEWVAFDSAGRIYVADSNHGRVLVFDAGGRQLATIPQIGRAHV